MNYRSAVAGGGDGVRLVGSNLTAASSGFGGDGLQAVAAGVDFIDETIIDEKHCQYIREDGQCKSWPNKKAGSQYCVGHMRTMKALDHLNAALADIEGSDI